MQETHTDHIPSHATRPHRVPLLQPMLRDFWDLVQTKSRDTDGQVRTLARHYQTVGLLPPFLQQPYSYPFVRWRHWTSRDLERSTDLD